MKPEKAGNDFIEHLPYIETVIFSAGGYFGGFERTTVHFSGSQAVFDAETMNPPSAMAPAHYEGMTKSQFLAKLRSLHIEDWTGIRNIWPRVSLMESNGTLKSASPMAAGR